MLAQSSGTVELVQYSCYFIKLCLCIFKRVDAADCYIDQILFVPVSVESAPYGFHIVNQLRVFYHINYCAVGHKF